MSSLPPSDRSPYGDFATPQQMRADCVEVGENLRLEKAARRAVESAPPSIHFDEFPREVPKRDIEVSDAAARLAGALHLHLD